jgi:hypothetical protein
MATGFRSEPGASNIMGVIMAGTTAASPANIHNAVNISQRRLARTSPPSFQTLAL